MFRPGLTTLSPKPFLVVGRAGRGKALVRSALRVPVFVGDIWWVSWLSIDYMLGQWKPLSAFLDDPMVPLDNNVSERASERALRGLVVGRKNHYGSRSERGTQVAAILYSIMETAKQNGLDPHEWVVNAEYQMRAEPDVVPLPLAWATTHVNLGGRRYPPPAQDAVRRMGTFHPLVSAGLSRRTGCPDFFLCGIGRGEVAAIEGRVSGSAIFRAKHAINRIIVDDLERRGVLRVLFEVLVDCSSNALTRHSEQLLSGTLVLELQKVVIIGDNYEHASLSGEMEAQTGFSWFDVVDIEVGSHKEMFAANTGTLKLEATPEPINDDE